MMPTCYFYTVLAVFILLAVSSSGIKKGRRIPTSLKTINRLDYEGTRYIKECRGFSDEASWAPFRRIPAEGHSCIVSKLSGDAAAIYPKWLARELRVLSWRPLSSSLPSSAGTLSFLGAVPVLKFGAVVTDAVTGCARRPLVGGLLVGGGTMLSSGVSTVASMDFKCTVVRGGLELRTALRDYQPSYAAGLLAFTSCASKGRGCNGGSCSSGGSNSSGDCLSWRKILPRAQVLLYLQIQARAHDTVMRRFHAHFQATY